MKLQTLPGPQVQLTLKKEPIRPSKDAPPPSNGFEPGQEPPQKHTSWFHRTTGALSGATTLATAGSLLLGPLGGGMGADGLIYPALGMLVGAGAGLIGGALAAGAFSSNEGKTSLFHRSTAILSGALVGAATGVVFMTPLGGGMGAEGLIYPLLGLAGGGLLGATAFGIASGHFPDRIR